MPKNAVDFYCEPCGFVCCKKSNYDKHLLTSKHINRTLLNKKMPKNAKLFICKHCKKPYNVRNSLWYHEKKCATNININIIEESESDLSSNKELITFLMKENKELKTMIMEVIETM